MTYYLDVETDTEGRTRPDPLKDKIVTIQYQEFDDRTGNVKNDLVILKSWESSEKEILQAFLKVTGWANSRPDPWKFVVAGLNLSYDLIVISTRAKVLLSKDVSLAFLWSELPKIDLKHVMVLAARGNFRETRLDSFVKNRQWTGKNAVRFIDEKNWTSLESYIRSEARAFFVAYRTFMNCLNELRPADESY